ncbi:TPA: DUF3396 domain-containing protein [Burkholderia orbicola]|uniref:DUF3396 domain-containing protein n=1 Tax=Burkholderia cenocepacia TaxID=95486 RepID=UPI0021AB6B2B|nr:DUF3396 domain-containing protein [Burkholderia cenocepacia]
MVGLPSSNANPATHAAHPKLGRRPCARVLRSGVFEALFDAFANNLPAAHGHDDQAVKVPPMGRRPNEASEYFYVRRFGPGIDVGDPIHSTICQLDTKIKPVDWLNALDGNLVHAVSGASSPILRPDWPRASHSGAVACSSRQASYWSPACPTDRESPSRHRLRMSS